MSKSSNNWLLLAAGVLGCTLSAPGATQDFPQRPVTLVVPYAAGGSADILPRRLAEHMKQSLGQPVIVENVPGAAGSIGVQHVARATPDGQTIGLGTWSTHVANAAILSLKYDVMRDFEPIGLVATSPIMIAARKTFPAESLQQLIAWLKANPDKATQATNGPGSVMHVAGVLFQQATNTRFSFVPYRGGGPAMQDLLAGHIDLYLGLAADILPRANANAVKVFAIASRSRSPAAPALHSVDEAGVPGLYVAAWFGLWGPKGMPQEAISKLNTAVRLALADPGTARHITKDLHMEIPPPSMQTPDELAKFQKAEIDKWWPLIQAAKIKPK